MSKNDDYTKVNLLNYLHRQKYYILIGIDLSRKTITSIPQQINFAEKLKKDDSATMLFIAEKQQKTILNFPRKWNIVNDNSKRNYNVGNEIIYNAGVLKSNLCDHNNTYILVRGIITIADHNLATQVAFKNCAQFTECITKTSGSTVDDAEDLDLVMPMCNLIKYVSNFSETTGSLCFYSKDEATNFNAYSANDDNFGSFKYKTKLLQNKVADRNNGILKNRIFTVPLKYLSNSWRTLEMPLINCKVELKLK